LWLKVFLRDFKNFLKKGGGKKGFFCILFFGCFCFLGLVLEKRKRGFGLKFKKKNNSFVFGV
jgi:hypothetical protein